MAIYGLKPILELEGCEGHHLTDEGPSLAEVIEQDFGEQGLERFRSFEVRLDVPWNTDYQLRFRRSDTLKGNNIEPIGKVYEITDRKIHGMDARGVRLSTAIHDDKRVVVGVTMDLNPENSSAQYLKMIVYHYTLQESD